ncbi:MAG TPA: M48 family metalloprotease [Solirubrobacterales bacterium]|nr:M48 family metalloprotease [Solirubrobacterales bacterium]
MSQGRRSNLLLAGVALVAVVNGLFLGLALYGVLATVLKLIHGHAPPFGYALLIGTLGAGGLLMASLLRERALRHDEYLLWTPMPAESEEHPLLSRLRLLTHETSLERPPALGWIESPEKNAFTVADSRNEASIILTAGLIEALRGEEIETVLAQQLAHVERADVKAVGFADAVAGSIRDLARIKGQFLWGPGAITREVAPILVVCVVGGALLTDVERSSGEGAGASFLVFLVALGLLYLSWQALKRSWRGLGQLLLQGGVFGPLSLVEAALATPTAALLSHLVSRARVYEADERAVELTGNPDALAAALRRVANVEDGGTGPWLGERRYSLFVAPLVDEGRWAWLTRQRATHPSISSRLEKIGELSRR